jgi:large subunit ribosomal protein L21
MIVVRRLGGTLRGKPLWRDRIEEVSMYAIFETGGKQYKVAAGDVVRVEKLPDAEEGKKVKFDKILAVNDGKTTHVGTPYLDAATVNATVTEVGKGDKVIVFKFKAKKGYRRKQGHRQPFTELEIESASLGGKTVFKQEKPKKADKPDAKKKKDDADEKTDEKEVLDAKDDAVKSGDAETKSAAPDEDKEAKSEIEDEGKAKADAEADSAEEAETEAESSDANSAGDTESEAKSSDADDAEAETEAPDAGETEADAESSDADSTDDAEAEAKPSGDVKMKKADIMAKLDELGAPYAKNAKKDELLAILAEAEK